MLQLDIDDSAIQRTLQSLRFGLDDLEPAFTQIGEYYLGKIDQRFEQEGPGWSPLNPKYRQRKQRLGAIDKILQFSGLLRKSIEYQASSDGLSIGSTQPYAPAHELGAPSKNIVARSFLQPDDDDTREFGAIILAYLRQQVAE